MIATGGRAVGDATGGSGPEIDVGADFQVISNMSYDLRGGNADMTDGTGGQGGYLGIDSNLMPTQDAHHWNVKGGHADTDGDDGEVVIDGAQIFP
jgi:hypothetical protein